MLSFVLQSSLEKIFPNEEPKGIVEKCPTLFQNETFSFQIACYTDEERWLWRGPLSIRVETNREIPLKIYQVGLVPSEFPSYPEPDEDYFTSMPTLLPDVLVPLENELEIKLTPNHWKSLWMEVKSESILPAGDHPIHISFEDKEGIQVGEVHLTLHIIPYSLPRQTLLHTEWFHADCLAQFYKVPVFSEDHWHRIEQFMGVATEHGMNMILTPLFTPPLDTEIGGERLTVQLIDIIVEKGKYCFDFEKLRRWVEVAQKVGFEYFEMAHLFTQWGAQATPKIMAVVEGEMTRIFGWETAANSELYREFLGHFLPQLDSVLADMGIKERCFLHVSDEPALKDLASYRSAKEVLTTHMKDYPIIDALSDLAFYETGAVACPIPASNHIQGFIDAGVKDLWTYYCCAQSKQVSNRFMALPSFRNRVIGSQLYKYDIKGFLHWGYNFWNTQFSKKAIDPFKVTDAGGAFPSGDAFLVYPTEEGPITSIRMKVFFEALQDLRAMRLLETLSSREEVIATIEAVAEMSITFSVYPHSETYVLNLRQAINNQIEKKLKLE